MNRRETGRFKSFIRGHPDFYEFAVIGDAAEVDHFDPWELVLSNGVPSAMLQRLKKEFEIVEFKRRLVISDKRRRAGRKGGLRTQEKRRLTTSRAAKQAKVKQQSSK